MVLSVLLIGWLLAALFEHGPTWPAVIVTALLVWALFDLVNQG